MVASEGVDPDTPDALFPCGSSPALAESLPVAAFFLSVDGTLLYANRRFRRLCSQLRIAGRRLVDLLHADDVDCLEAALAQAAREGGCEAESDQAPTRLRLSLPGGSTPTVEARISGARDDRGAMIGYVGVLDRVPETRELHDRLAAVLEATTDLVGLSDDSGRVIYMNRAARERFGFARGDLSAATTDALFPPEAWELYYRDIRPAVLRGEAWNGEVPTYDGSGQVVPVWFSVVGEATAGGKVEWLATIGRDVSEQKRREVDLAHRATHDPLTGLPNRSLLINHLELAIARSLRAGTMVGLLFLDLDHFKAVNDRHGHEAGDELLVEVAHRIKAVVRPTDTVARLGGDEFVVLCEGVEGEGEARAIARRVCVAIESEPIAVRGVKLRLTASVGVALSGSSGEHPEALLGEADAGMYRAKQRGRSRIEVFDQSLRERTARRAELAHELSVGIAHGHIGVAYQPLVDVATGQVIGVEALAQWHHRERGLLKPPAFIDLAEETGLIVPVGLTVLRQACRQGRRWERRLGPAAPPVHVNLSARQLADRDLVPLVEGLLDETGLSPDRLCLEVSENALHEGPSEALEALKATGVRLVVDGFGAGHSSLRFLRHIPVEALKVDRSFVDGLGPDPEDSAIVTAVVTLAHTLDLRAIAVGVERSDQLIALRTLGCDGAQGFFFAPPGPAADIEPKLAQRFAEGL